MIDHITISDDLKNDYISNSTDIEDARTYIANYNSVTASDHLPVMRRFQFCKITRPSNIKYSAFQNAILDTENLVESLRQKARV